MAVLGLDTLLLMTALLPYIKLSKYFEMTHKVLGKLIIVVPADLSGMDEVVKTEGELTNPKTQPNVNNKKKKKQQAQQNAEEVKFDLSMTLHCAKQRVSLEEQAFYPLLEQLIWSCGVAVAAFWASELLYCGLNNVVFPGRQAATSLFLLGIAFQAFTFLAHINVQMSARMANQENQLAVAMGMVSFGVALGLLGVANGSRMLVDLDFAPGLGATSEPEEGRGAMWWGVATLLAACAGVFAAAVVVPSLRFARLYHECVMMRADRGELHESGDGKATRLLWHVAFFAPLFVVLLYVEPMTGEYATRVLFGGSREAWTHARSIAVVLLSLSRVVILPSVVQRFLDSGFLVLRHMVSDPKRFAQRTVRSYVRGQYWLTSYAAMQYLAPAVISFCLALARPRVSGDGMGLCGAAWSLAGLERPQRPAGGAPAGSDMLSKLLAEVLPESLAPSSLAPPAALVAPLLDVLLVWSNLSWFAFSALGLLYFREQNTAAGTAETLTSRFLAGK